MANYAGFGALFFKIIKPKIKYLLTLQEGDPIPYIKKRVRFVYPIFKMIFTKADMIQAISNYLANFAKDMGYKGDLAVVPNGVDVIRFTKDYPKEEIPLIKETTEDRYFITTSRLVKKNGIRDVIISLTYLPDKYKFLVIGDGPDIDDLKKLALDKSVHTRVKFLGQIDQKDIPKYLKASDFFIRPSLSEGMGNSFIEAMAAEIPVIATEVGGIPDFLFPPENKSGMAPTGFFCRVNDPKSIAEVVMKIDENLNLKKEVIKNALEMVKKKYDWSLISSKMKDIFNKLC